ncbi:hypothetical protein JQ597_08045 [Bradyrhizobium sp. AUGA SZCCT0177]|uniref:hypothetical protein n=1 Tax=Bradyrhizobium sp. AUGA SZCCT0177 TaxID=2807665 RepID=UPI001BA587EF|nr:hypothetical protein [Bradyrhizobium sp. AUGA SZCCT0177]MBR1281982.1 hypothetical protein [Bradyrhizobium sp. AUGA SZCCT0177]
MNANNEPRKSALYLLLPAIQILGTITFIWQAMPEFRQVAINPGEQLPRDGWSDLISFSRLCVMQIAFWCRERWVPIPFRSPNVARNRQRKNPPDEISGRLKSGLATRCEKQRCE